MASPFPRNHICINGRDQIIHEKLFTFKHSVHKLIPELSDDEWKMLQRNPSLSALQLIKHQSLGLGVRTTAAISMGSLIGIIQGRLLFFESKQAAERHGDYCDFSVELYYKCYYSRYTCTTRFGEKSGFWRLIPLDATLDGKRADKHQASQILWYANTSRCSTNTAIQIKWRDSIPYFIMVATTNIPAGCEIIVRYFLPEHIKCQCSAMGQECQDSG